MVMVMVMIDGDGDGGDDGGDHHHHHHLQVREQSQSIVRGEHPIAFMLPTVSLSDVGSETEVNRLFLCCLYKLFQICSCPWFCGCQP